MITLLMITSVLDIDWRNHDYGLFALKNGEAELREYDQSGRHDYTRWQFVSVTYPNDDQAVVVIKRSQTTTSGRTTERLDAHEMSATAAVRTYELPSGNLALAGWSLLKRKLVGTWQRGELRVAYKLISNESAILEQWNVGTPRETATVIHQDQTGLMLTHYCAQGNQARLRSTAIGDDSVTFSFVDVTNRAVGAGVLVERMFTFKGDAYDMTEAYDTPKRELTTYHFTRAR